MPGADAAFAAIGLMAVATYLTRVAGVWLVSLAPATPRLERFLRHLSGSVLAALVVPAAINGDVARFAGIAGAATMMVMTRKPLLSLAFGTGLTALLRL